MSPAARNASSEASPSPRRRWLIAIGTALAVAAAGAMAAWRLGSPRELPAPADTDPGSSERQLVEATFPPKLPLGKRWTVEVEGDLPTIDGYWKPRRVRSELSVAEVAGDLVMIDAHDLHFRRTRHFFVLRASTLAVERVQAYQLPAPSLGADMHWERVAEDVVSACDFFLDPSHLPIVHRATATGDVLDVLGERNDGAVRQRAWVDGGLIRFELQPRNRHDAVLTIAWRPGDPWWAKYECYVPGKSDNLPPARRDGSFSRPARARLVAVDGVPVEPLPWEHPPTDWMSAR